MPIFKTDTGGHTHAVGDLRYRVLPTTFPGAAHRGVQMVRAAPRRLRRKGGDTGGEGTRSGKSPCWQLTRSWVASSRRCTTRTSRAPALALPAHASTARNTAASCGCCLHKRTWRVSLSLPNQTILVRANGNVRVP